jgi:hypothetical protein
MPTSPASQAAAERPMRLIQATNAAPMKGVSTASSKVMAEDG